MCWQRLRETWLPSATGEVTVQRGGRLQEDDGECFEKESQGAMGIYKRGKL